MEEKKVPVLTENFRFRAPDPEPVLLPTERPVTRKRTLSSCLLFLLLGIFVFILGCFAVYAAISVGSSHGNDSSSKSLALEQPREVITPNENLNKLEPVIHFQIEVNGKKCPETGGVRNNTEIIITHTDKPQQSNEFSSIRNFIKKIAGDLRPNLFNPPTLESKISNEPSAKPKVISVESIEIRKIPSDISVNLHPLDIFDPSPFEDVLDVFNPIPGRFNKPINPISQNKESAEKETPKNSKKENSDTKFFFPDFDDFFSDIFNERLNFSPKNQTKSVPPKPFFPNVDPFDPFFFPLGFSNRDKPQIMNTKPREENNILKNKEKPYLDRYTNEKKSSDNDILNSILGFNPFMPKNLLEEPDVLFFNIPKFPKKYQSKSLTKDKEEIIKESNPKQMEPETPIPTTEPTKHKSLEGEIMPSTVSPTESTTPKKEILWG